MGDPVSFLSLGAWQSNSDSHYRLSYVVTAMECTDKPVQFTSGLNPKCNLTYINGKQAAQVEDVATPYEPIYENEEEDEEEDI